MALTSTGVQSTAPANAGVNLASEIEVLANFDLQQLRIRWRKLLPVIPVAVALVVAFVALMFWKLPPWLGWLL